MELLQKQHKFLFDTTHFYKAFVGGQGSGKTLVGMLCAIFLSRINKNCSGVIVSPTYKMSSRICQKAMLDILNGKHIISTNRIRHTFHKSEERVYFPQWNSEIYFSNADNPDKLRGSNLAWAILDEAGVISYDCYLEIEARVRDPRAKLKQILVTTTPGDYDWLEKVFPPETTDKKLYINARTDENTFLESAYANDKREQYDFKRQARYLDGQYIDLYQDAIYYCFNKLKNVINNFNPLANLPVLVSCDFNRNPCVWLLAQMVQGKLFFFDEIYMESARTALMIEELKSKVLINRSPKYAALLMYGDSTSLSIRNTAASYSDWELIDNAFANYPNYDNRVYPNPFVKDRIVIINKELENGNILFTSNMKYTIEDMQKTMWAVNKHEKDKKTKDKARGERTHATDCVDYLTYALFSRYENEIIIY
jgi:hypothetical protein